VTAVPPSPLAGKIDALLPQTQCGKCGYAGCMPYAEAIAAGNAQINRCPPGGDAGVRSLAQLLGRAVLALDPACGEHRPLHLAFIDEARCIGCTICIQACPVDAIVGANQLMHTVVAADCTGCELCVAPCPMDCIAMRPAPAGGEWARDDAAKARERMHARRRRLAREASETDARPERNARAKLDELSTGRNERSDLAAAELARRKSIVENALARVRARRTKAP
jgi:electron transport complex protein RnfB